MCQLQRSNNGGAKGRELSENLTRSSSAELTLSPLAQDHGLPEPGDGGGWDPRGVADKFCLGPLQDLQHPARSVRGQSWGH